MEISSKQRAYLRGLAGSRSAIMQIGKDGLTDNLIRTLNDALEARELIKVSVLETAEETPAELLDRLADALGAVPVSVIGRKLILYLQARDPKKRKIELP